MQTAQTQGLGNAFLSTPSARRATRYIGNNNQQEQISIHALREEGDLTLVLSMTVSMNFYPRPPRGGRRVARGKSRPVFPISIHALREEGDRILLDAVINALLFLSTPSARRATSCHALFAAASAISIHALREEGDNSFQCSQSSRLDFYPRPPRGGRLYALLGRCMRFYFYPRPPRGGRQEQIQYTTDYIQKISIHALREEGDSKNRDKISIFKQIIQHSARI